MPVISTTPPVEKPQIDSPLSSMRFSVWAVSSCLTAHPHGPAASASELPSGQESLNWIGNLLLQSSCRAATSENGRDFIGAGEADDWLVGGLQSIALMFTQREPESQNAPSYCRIPAGDSADPCIALPCSHSCALISSSPWPM